MELIHGSHKPFKFAPRVEDVISTMPDNVITNYILDRLPIQEAVRTSILSTDWRFKWTMLSHLVFDDKFFEYLLPKDIEKCCGKISRLLLYLKGPITKFVLYIDHRCFSILDAEDINSWVMFLSTKGIKDLTLINKSGTPLKLHTHLFSCLELKHLILYNCNFHLAPRFRGFTNLLSLNLNAVNKCEEFLIRSPLLEILKISYHSLTGEMKRDDISTLGNLKVLSLPLCKLDNMAMMTSVNIIQLIGYFSKLRELTLDFYTCKVSTYTGQRLPSAALPCLKILNLDRIDFSRHSIVSCVFELIYGFRNLQTVKIQASDEVPRPPSLWLIHLNCRGTGELQLQKVVLRYIRGLENEVFLIKTLLASSPFLKTMHIRASSSSVVKEMTFATKLLKLHRASSSAEIDLIWLA